MRDVMIDLETLGTRPGSTILSIGAVEFSAEGTSTLGPEFYSVISRLSCEVAGLHEDPETLAWWAKQSTDAQYVLIEASDPPAKPLYKVLWLFDRYLAQFKYDEVRVWGNGAAFDLPILAEAYHAVNMASSWKFYNERCHRTLKELYPEVTIDRVGGTHHNALDDARAQARQAATCLALQRQQKLIATGGNFTHDGAGAV